MQEYLEATYFIDKDHPEIAAFAQQHAGNCGTMTRKAVALYYAVRDCIRYNPYTMEPDKAFMKASSTLKRGQGYCVAKAVLLAACARNMQIPARLGFADVKNHLNTAKLKDLMGTGPFKLAEYTPAVSLKVEKNKIVINYKDSVPANSVKTALSKKGKFKIENYNIKGNLKDVDKLVLKIDKQYLDKIVVYSLDKNNIRVSLRDKKAVNSTYSITKNKITINISPRDKPTQVIKKTKDKTIYS